MAGYEDMRVLEAKGVRVKRKFMGKEEMIGVDAKLTASVSRNLFMVEVPTDNIKLSFRLQDVIALAKATNRVYLDSKKNQTPENK
ncbi:MAG: hypothetical protein LUE92_13625 [Clostridiales bacterium]|nr:hypothetical protein [Clostridiales bacterium]